MPHPRVPAIDLGRGASVYVMMLVHALWMYGRVDVQESAWFGALVHFAGRGTAMFLLAMGFSFGFSRRTTLAAALRRGLAIFALGYLMNALKFLVPYFLGFMPASFVAAYGFRAPLSWPELGFMLLTGDILQLAGISFAVLGVLQRVRDRRALLALALAVAAASGALRGLRPGIASLDYLADLLWGVEYDVYFPVFPWLSVILFGMYLGKLHQHDERRFPRALLAWGIGLSSAGYALCQLDPGYHYVDFFHAGPGGALASMGAGSLLFWLAFVLAPRLSTSWLGPALTFASKHVTSLYVTQWVLVCWGMGLVGYHELGLLGVLAAAVVVGALTLGCVAGWLSLAQAENAGSRRQPYSLES